jgi:hypothetical protein
MPMLVNKPIVQHTAPKRVLEIPHLRIKAGPGACQCGAKKKKVKNQDL